MSEQDEFLKDLGEIKTAVLEQPLTEAVEAPEKEEDTEEVKKNRATKRRTATRFSFIGRDFIQCIDDLSLGKCLIFK